MLNVKPISELCNLMYELAKGREFGEKEGWLTLEAVEEFLGIADE